MNRRAFLASSGSATLLAACAPVGPAAGPSPLADASCLPPALADDSRVIRTVAGLRPYRSGGFVVREERLGAKRLVHNYGHGGAGITLSWGSSRLAVDIGLTQHAGPVAVIGAGVMGLSTALLAMERGFPAIIYSQALPPHTTSNIAGGQIHPTGHYRRSEVTDAWLAQYGAAMDYSWRRFQLLVGDEYGVRWLPTYETGAGAPPPDLAPYQPAMREMTGAANPFPVDPVRRYHTMYVEMGRYLRRLTEDFLRAGGRFVIRRFEDPAQVEALPETLAFNCTGLGAAELFGDEGLEPARGQLAILLPQPEIEYAYSLPDAYMFPRPDGILLGGTWERGQWKAEPHPDAIAGIIRRNAALAPRNCLT